MTKFQKRLFHFCMGLLIVFVAGCAAAPTQPPTVEATGIPTSTAGIPSAPVQPTPSPTVSAPTAVNSTARSPTANTPERIKFAAASTSATVTEHLEPSGSKQYILHALAGQTMTINLAFTAAGPFLSSGETTGMSCFQTMQRPRTFKGNCQRLRIITFRLRAGRKAAPTTA